MKNLSQLLQYKTALIIVVTVIVIVFSFMLLRKSTATVRSFEECRKVGGALLESYPEQCLFDGKTYTNESQSKAGEWYIGLTEEDALARAKDTNVPARVVERDGESLPVTMDYVVGRLNFAIKDGRVINVSVEGEETRGEQ